MCTQNFKQVLFQRRKDLTFQTRFLIAYIVLFQYSWGTITRLSSKYNVSRQFIYNNCNYFSKLFTESPDKTIVLSEEEALKFMLSTRMEGKCSIPSISELMKRFGLSYHSVGSISEMLKNIGKSIGNELNIEYIEGFTFSVCSDEIFVGQSPILITLDPVSLLILNIEIADNRKAESWVKHFKHVKSQGIEISQLTSDEGTGMKSAMEQELEKAERQSDTFHAVAHRLGVFVDRFFKRACKYLDQATKYEQLFDKAKTEKTRNKYLKEHLKYLEMAENAIELYIYFEFLYHCLLECFQVFDNDGKLKDEKMVIQDFDVALEYMKELNNPEIKKEINSIENCKSDLFTFFKTAQEIVGNLLQNFNSDIVNLLCLAWQVHKNMIKAKDNYRKNKLQRREKYILSDVKELVGDEYEKLQQTVYQSLNRIIQSSAAVECINSLLRFYLNSSNNKVTKEFLNLFMFYHNHRRFKNGERKGKTPMEIATNTQQKDDWLDLLLKKAG
ncbi:MAG: pheromone/general odorant binding protein [Bacteroidales bacterium]|nr:pheromone/general odorant binding protein [Bacteroidales bacterium]